MDSLNTCIRELQRQTRAQRLALDDAHCGYEESRREQVRLQEELVTREKSTSRHSYQKHPWNGRIDEFSVCTHIERKSWYDTAAHFTDTGVARGCELHEWFRIISRDRIELHWNFSHVPSQPTVVPSPRAMSSRDKCMPIDTWNFVWNTRKRFWQTTSFIRFNTDFIKEFFTLRIEVPQMGTPCWTIHECLQEGRQPWILFLQQKDHRIKWLYSKYYRYRSFRSKNSPLHHHVQMVKRRQDQKLQWRKFDFRNERFEKGAVVTSRRRSSGIERGTGDCCQLKAKGQCSRGDQCSFRHHGHERAKPTPKTAPSSEPPTPRGRSASRKGTLIGRSSYGKTNRQPCKKCSQGTSTTLPCDCWHRPECQFQKSESGCKFGKKVLVSALEGWVMKGRRRVVTKVQ